MINDRGMVAASRVGLLLSVSALVSTACGMPATVGADTPLEAPSTVHPEDERYEADVLRPEDEGRAPLSDFGATPPERGTATTVPATYDATVVKHYIPEPFEVAVVESRTMFGATLEEVGVTPDFNTDSAGLGVRLYSPTSLARYSDLLTMERTVAPSQDRADWLGGEPSSEQGDDR